MQARHPISKLPPDPGPHPGPICGPVWALSCEPIKGCTYIARAGLLLGRCGWLRTAEEQTGTTTIMMHTTDKL